MKRLKMFMSGVLIGLAYGALACGCVWVTVNISGRIGVLVTVLVIIAVRWLTQREFSFLLMRHLQASFPAEFARAEDEIIREKMKGA